MAFFHLFQTYYHLTEFVGRFWKHPVYFRISISRPRVLVIMKSSCKCKKINLCVIVFLLTNIMHISRVFLSSMQRCTYYKMHYSFYVYCRILIFFRGYFLSRNTVSKYNNMKNSRCFAVS